MNYAKRLFDLGTETAFAVSQDAKKHEERGLKIFPFHLGDINISTPTNIINAMLKA